MTILLSIAVCNIAFGVIYYISNRDYYVEVINLLGCATLGACVGCLIGIIIAFSIGNELTDCVSEVELVSLKDNSSVHGSFYLGSGVVNGTMVYTFYYKDGSGFKLKQLDYKRVQIKYTKGTPKVVTYTRCETNNPKNYWGVSLDIGSQSYVIEVPEGTIQNNFRLDAE